MSSTYFSFIRTSPIATYDVNKGKELQSDHVPEKEKPRNICEQHHWLPKNLYQYMVYCFIQDLVFLVSHFSTIFTLACLNFTEILIVKVYFTIFYLYGPYDLPELHGFLFVCYQQVASLFQCKHFIGKSPFYGLKYTFFFYQNAVSPNIDGSDVAKQSNLIISLISKPEQ